MRLTTTILLACALAGLSVSAYALFVSRQMTDIELDEVYAGGFEIDPEAVLAFRAAVAQTQPIPTTLPPSSCAAIQTNIAAVYASGDITQTTITNNNQADAATLAQQTNLAVIASQDGAVKDSLIVNANSARLDGASPVISQESIGVIAAKGDITGCVIRNQNLAQGVTAVEPAIETLVVNNLPGVNSLQITATQSGTQKTLGVFVSQEGRVLDSLVESSSR